MIHNSGGESRLGGDAAQGAMQTPCSTPTRAGPGLGGYPGHWSATPLARALLGAPDNE